MWTPYQFSACLNSNGLLTFFSLFTCTSRSYFGSGSQLEYNACGFIFFLFLCCYYVLILAPTLLQCQPVIWALLFTPSEKSETVRLFRYWLYAVFVIFLAIIYNSCLFKVNVFWKYTFHLKLRRLITLLSPNAENEDSTTSYKQLSLAQGTNGTTQLSSGHMVSI